MSWKSRRLGISHMVPSRPGGADMRESFASSTIMRLIPLILIVRYLVNPSDSAHACHVLQISARTGPPELSSAGWKR